MKFDDDILKYYKRGGVIHYGQKHFGVIQKTKNWLVEHGVPSDAISLNKYLAAPVETRVYHMAVQDFMERPIAFFDVFYYSPDKIRNKILIEEYNKYILEHYSVLLFIFAFENIDEDPVLYQCNLDGQKGVKWEKVEWKYDYNKLVLDMEKARAARYESEMEIEGKKKNNYTKELRLSAYSALSFIMLVIGLDAYGTYAVSYDCTFQV